MMWRVFCALTTVFAAFALYTVLTSKALDEGLNPGVLVLLRDIVCATILLLNLHVRKEAWLPDFEDQSKIIVLGALGLYFGQYLVIIGVQHSDAVLVSYWSNVSPVATYVLGLLLHTEQCEANIETVLKLSGLFVTVGGAIAASIGDSRSTTNPHRSIIVATVCFGLMVVLGSASFWHLQKSLLQKYSAHQTAAWYYTTGLAVLLLVVVPGATTGSSWTFNQADLLALGVAIPIWPVCTFLLAYANNNATPTTVMVFSPAQIVFTFLFDFVFNGKTPSVLEVVGAAGVVLGLLLFCSGVAKTAMAHEIGHNKTQHSVDEDLLSLSRSTPTSGYLTE